MKKILIAVAGLALAASLFAATTSAPSTGAATPATPATTSGAATLTGNTTVATVNLQGIIQNYAGTPALQQAYQNEQNQLQANLQTMQTQLTAQQSELNKLGSKATQAQIQTFQNLQNQYQTAYNQAQQTMNDFQTQQMATFKAQVQAVIVQVAKQNGYTLVLDSQAVWAGGTDITSQVLATLNASVPKAPATAPAATKAPAKK